MSCNHEPLELPCGHERINFASIMRLRDSEEPSTPPLAGSGMLEAVIEALDPPPPAIQIRLCRKCHLLYWVRDEVLAHPEED